MPEGGRGALQVVVVALVAYRRSRDDIAVLDLEESYISAGAERDDEFAQERAASTAGPPLAERGPLKTRYGVTEGFQRALGRCPGQGHRRPACRHARRAVARRHRRVLHRARPLARAARSAVRHARRARQGPRRGGRGAAVPAQPLGLKSQVATSGPRTPGGQTKVKVWLAASFQILDFWLALTNHNNRFRLAKGFQCIFHA